MNVMIQGFYKPESSVGGVAYKAYIKAFSVKAKECGLMPACFDKNT